MRSAVLESSVTAASSHARPAPATTNGYGASRIGGAVCAARACPGCIDEAEETDERRPMTWGSRRRFLRVAAIASVCLVSIVAVTGQAAVGQSPAPPAPMSQDVFKSAAVLRNIPPDTFLEAMGMFANSMGAD